MVMTACNISAGESPTRSQGRPAWPPLLRRLGVLKNKTAYEGGWTSICSTGSTTSPSEGKMEKYLLKPWGLRHKQRWGPSLIRGHLQIWRRQYHYQDDKEYTSTREHGIQTCRQPQGRLRRVPILSTQSQPMGLSIARPNFWPSSYPDLKTRM